MMILEGDRTLCGSRWSQLPTKIPDYHKLYFPISGHAVVTVDEQPIRLGSACTAFLPGRHRIQPREARKFDLYWLHFRPLAATLDHALSRHRQAVSWPRRKWAHWQETIRAIPQTCRDPRVPAELRLQAMLQEICADLLTRTADTDPAPASADQELERLMPAVQYMDIHAMHNPSLAAVAQVVHLSPTHFHRLFRRVFGLTPHTYMARRRLTLAHRLLTRSGMPVRRVAELTGYDSPYYFSRAFRRLYGASPRAFRSRKAVRETIV